jgi:flagellar M-ring protein FliF
MGKLLASLSKRQKITIAAVALLVLAAVVGMVRWNKERDFRPLFTNLSPEDANAIVTKLKESGTDYRLPETGGSVLVPSARLAELRLNMAAAGIPKSGRIGFELFDKTNFGTTDFAEHVNYRRALEGELERSVMALAEVEQARVHLTFPKDSVFLEAQQPAKASVLLKLKSNAKLAPRNVQAINHLIASAVEGLSPDAVSVLDMNGNLLGRPRKGLPNAPEVSEITLEYRQQIEAQLLAKINAALTPLLGAGKFHAGVSVECDFSGGEQSEEAFDPARSVMLSSQRVEDGISTSASTGVPGTASTLPRPTSRPGAGASGGITRVTENITYQPTRTVKRTHLPSGTVKKMSLAVLIDQDVSWEKDKNGYKRVLVPPPPEKLKIIKEQIAAVSGLDVQRGDQISVDSLPFESTLKIEPPPLPAAPKSATPGPQGLGWPPKLTQQQMIIAGAAAVGLLLVVAVLFVFLKKRKTKKKKATAEPGSRADLQAGAAAPGISGPAAPLAGALPGAPAAHGHDRADSLEKRIEAKLAERDAIQQEAEERALNALKAPVITKTAEVLAKHLRETIKKEPDVPAHILRTWIREEDRSN